MKSYCVKQKKQTECVPGSEKYVKAKNGRLMMKCKCSECGITKTKWALQATGHNNKTGSGISIPFPLVDFKKMWDVVSDPTLFKGPEVSAKEGRELIAQYKRQYSDYKRKAVLVVTVLGLNGKVMVED